MTNDIIALIANIALALSFVIGLVFGIAQVRAAARDRRERLTLETLREFQAREFLLSRKRVCCLCLCAIGFVLCIIHHSCFFC